MRLFMKDIKHIPLILFSISVLKTIIMGSSYQEALVLLVLGAVAGFYEYKSQDAAIQEMKELQEKQAQATLALAKTLDELRSGMNALKLSQGMKSNSLGR